MANYVYLEDEQGDLLDILYYCSDSCAKTDPNYDGWSGCHEVEHDEYCHNCGVIIGGISSANENPECDHRFPVVVNLIGEPEDEYCEHGTLVRTSFIENL